MENNLNSLNERFSKGEITLQEWRATYNDMFVDDLGVVYVVHVDFFTTDYYHLKHDKRTNMYYITNNCGFSLENCPSNFESIDKQLFDKALECYYEANNTYGNISFQYDNLIDCIERVYNSLD